MIYVVLEDGSRRVLDQAKVTLTWTEPGVQERVYWGCTTYAGCEKGLNGSMEELSRELTVCPDCGGDLTEITMNIPGADVEREFDLSQVEKFVMIEPTLMVKPGLMGGAGGIPVVGVAFRDTSDFAIEIPFPADYLDQVADGLKDEAAAARKLSSRTGEIQGKVDVQVATSMKEVVEAFGGTVLDPTTPVPGAKE